MNVTQEGIKKLPRHFIASCFIVIFSQSMVQLLLFFLAVSHWLTFELGGVIFVTTGYFCLAVRNLLGFNYELIRS